MFAVPQGRRLSHLNRLRFYLSAWCCGNAGYFEGITKVVIPVHAGAAACGGKLPKKVVFLK
jgi:hypothetical protein